MQCWYVPHEEHSTPYIKKKKRTPPSRLLTSHEYMQDKTPIKPDSWKSYITKQSPSGHEQDTEGYQKRHFSQVTINDKGRAREANKYKKLSRLASGNKS
ncbi:hypothetical protein TNIN_170011 [Trichonephila inaurata madagascariensis]|uniref:Uncharacterized protein n=1 Tax=Trichonephila inaurata madagascariensis TaxID=2747483 RepID=A0A8X6XNK2_9ARAC|nr:hypothetical protein TNIN_170011 [Trichonephila inaurata madagascariensis]